MKKRILAVFLALALCMGLAVPAFATDSDFVIEDGMLVEYNGPGGDVVIPSGVTGIEGGAFMFCTNLTGVTIPSSVTSIGYNAFGACTNLTSITIPGSVATIGNSAFGGCTGLTSVTISNGVTTIEESAFGYCTSLTSVTIPGSVTSIGSNVFEGCTGLTSVTIHSSVTRIDSLAFYGCTSLADIYYGGSEAQWNAIQVSEWGDFKDDLTNVTIHYNSTGPAVTFTDVPAGTWYTAPVAWAVEKGITNGTGNGKFSPAQSCTHAQILTFLYRADRNEGKAEGADMDKAINWARGKGMIGASFDGGKPCTRAEAVNYIWQALGREDAKASSFTDVPANAAYAKAVSWAVANGVTNGTNAAQTEFSPNDVCDRGTIVTFLHRAYVPEARLK